MSDGSGKVSSACQTFLTEAPQHAEAWSQMVHGLAAADALDRKTGELAYIAVLAALGRESGIPFHVAMARDSGASCEEVISAVLLGLPAAGTIVTQSLPAALAAYDAEGAG